MNINLDLMKVATIFEKLLKRVAFLCISCSSLFIGCEQKVDENYGFLSDFNGNVLVYSLDTVSAGILVNLSHPEVIDWRIREADGAVSLVIEGYGEFFLEDNVAFVVMLPDKLLSGGFSREDLAKFASEWSEAGGNSDLIMRFSKGFEINPINGMN